MSGRRVFCVRCGRDGGREMDPRATWRGWHMTTWLDGQEVRAWCPGCFTAEQPRLAELHGERVAG